MDKNKIILFFPRTEPDNIYRNLPIALLKIASQVVAKGFEVKVIDSRIDEDYENTIRKSLNNALCFGISSLTGYPILHSIRASKIAKEVNKDIPIIWGGWHSSILPEEVLKKDFVDIVIRGQGEKTVTELLSALSNGSSLEGMQGVSFKDLHGNIIHNPDRPFENVNNFYPVNFEIFDIGLYLRDTPLGTRTIFWNTSQGCPYHCGFCCTPTVYNRHWSSLSVSRILNEVEILVRRFGVNGILFTEDNFFTDEKRVRSICEGLIDGKLKIKWSTDARIDKVVKFSDEYFQLLKASGCAKLYLGAESGDQEVLDLIDKRIRVEDTLEVAELLDKHGIIAEFFLIVGFPVDPQKDLKHTLNMMRQIKKNFPNHQATPFLYTPYPGTKLFNLAVEKGLEVPIELEGWIRWTQHAPTVPWVDKKYADKIDRLTKFYFPFAYPSESLKNLMKDKKLGFLYKLIHRLARLRVEKNNFIFPVEWWMIKYFYYNIKRRYNVFKGLKVPR